MLQSSARGWSAYVMYGCTYVYRYMYHGQHGSVRPDEVLVWHSLSDSPKASSSLTLELTIV